MNPATLNPRYLPWHKDCWELFACYLEQDRVPQALLITGQKGIGKEHLALQLAQSLLCDNRQEDGLFCNQCHFCQLFNVNTHPDFISVQPDESGKNIKIEQIRELINTLSLKPLYQQHRIVIINPADAMTHASANGFLKCLEEPPEKTIIILISEIASSLPATITSRCQQIKISVPDFQTADKWLQQHNIEQDRQTLINLAQGSPLLAQTYASDDTLQSRADLFNTWLSVAEQKINPVSVSENWSKNNDIRVLIWMTSWIIDIIKYCYRCQQSQIFNPDLKQNLQELAHRLKLNDLFQFYNLLLITRQRFETNLNKQLIFEEILIKWSQINQRK